MRDHSVLNHVLLLFTEKQPSEVVNDDTPCMRCGRYDQPQWVSICALNNYDYII